MTIWRTYQRRTPECTKLDFTLGGIKGACLRFNSLHEHGRERCLRQNGTPLFRELLVMHDHTNGDLLV